MTARTDREHDAPDLGRLIDRLVDGELTDEARRVLLLRLDSEPSGAGWRRCALAFLEARDWRDALGGPAIAADDRGSAAPSSSTAPPRITSVGVPGRPVRWLGLAASLMLAFAAGRAGRPEAGPPSPAASLVAGADDPVRAVDPPGWAERLATAPGPEDEDLLGLDGRPRPGWPGATWRPSPSSTVQAEGGPWAWSDSPETPALPGTVLDDWRRRGFEVETRPRVVSVGREDGRPVAVPVNEVRVRYVGDRTY